MKYDFIAIGGATRDISFFTDDGILVNNRRDVLRQELLAFEYGAKIKVDKFFYSFGGGAANAAVCLANFGLKTACLACVGKDEAGRSIVKNLQNRRVDSRLCESTSREDSGSSFVLVHPSGERIIFGSRGANRYLEISHAAIKAMASARNIYIASLTGNWLANLKKIFAATGQAKIIWNPGATQYSGGIKKISSFVKKTYVFTLNKDEAIELILSSDKHRHLRPADLNDVVKLVKTIKSFGPEIAVVTLGGAGVVAYDGRKIYRYRPVPDKKRVDTTGIGDIFNSSFAAGLELYGGDIDRALKLGLKNTAAKIQHLGAQNGLIKFKK